jgi:hypothetical protein
MIVTTSALFKLAYSRMSKAKGTISVGPSPAFVWVETLDQFLGMAQGVCGKSVASEQE